MKTFQILVFHRRWLKNFALESLSEELACLGLLSIKLSGVWLLLLSYVEGSSRRLLPLCQRFWSAEALILCFARPALVKVNVITSSGETITFRHVSVTLNYVVPRQQLEESVNDDSHWHNLLDWYCRGLRYDKVDQRSLRAVDPDLLLIDPFSRNALKREEEDLGRVWVLFGQCAAKYSSDIEDLVWGVVLLDPTWMNREYLAGWNTAGSSSTSWGKRSGSCTWRSLKKSS